jgi:hypothetical protein
MFNFDFNIEPERKRYIKPTKKNGIKAKHVVYQNAKKLAKDIDIKRLDKVFCLTSGNFVFGDFLEAFIVENKFLLKEITIATLSLSSDNIDSILNLHEFGHVNKINLIVSDYFYCHERIGLIKEIYEKLDIETIDFQLAVAFSHCKITIFETTGGDKCVIHGSANLRSSQNIEQFSIEQNNELYDFYYIFLKQIIKEYKTINKSVRYKNIEDLLIYDNETFSKNILNY